MIIDYIKKEDLIIGQSYYCDARNFTIGVWNGKGFEYNRQKFNTTYLDVEYHYDDGTPHGTVKPLSRWGEGV